ncbi:MAG: WD40 domain protein beta Propeller [Rhodanobacteraceae bacterium]|jgi:Tol biopolymer transport system component|nr:MAG: WD40 domain protein beta Propeller [Rhodanobacteraceae bacterium]
MHATGLRKFVSSPVLCAGAGLGIAFSVQAGTPARHWAPSAISSPLFESHGAFDYAHNDFYFVRSSRDFRGWRIMVSHCGKQGWETPVDASFAGDGVEADPFITPDGKHLYFISTRSTDGQRHKDLDIWRVDLQADGQWGEPQRLPEPVNSRGQEWFPRPAVDGWLYFGSDRPGGFGKTDIWRARQDANGKWIVENAGAAINTTGDEYEPLPSPDGQRMIVMASDGLYMTRLENGRWTPKTKLGRDVNVNGTEIGAVFSPSGKSLLFSRDTKGPLSGEFFLWQPDGPEAWPPACGKEGVEPEA